MRTNPIQTTGFRSKITNAGGCRSGVGVAADGVCSVAKVLSHAGLEMSVRLQLLAPVC